MMIWVGVEKEEEVKEKTEKKRREIELSVKLSSFLVVVSQISAESSSYCFGDGLWSFLGGSK